MGGENGKEGGEEDPPQAARFGVTVSKGGRMVVMCRSGVAGTMESAWRASYGEKLRYRERAAGACGQ